MASRTEFLLCGLSSTVSPTYACAQHLILLEIFLSLQFRIFAITKVICTLRPSLSFQVLICNKLSYLGLFYALPINICCENTNINGMWQKCWLIQIGSPPLLGLTLSLGVLTRNSEAFFYMF